MVYNNDCIEVLEYGDAQKLQLVISLRLACRLDFVEPCEERVGNPNTEIGEITPVSDRLTIFDGSFVCLVDIEQGLTGGVQLILDLVEFIALAFSWKMM